jgi:hypothetical protein
MARTPTKIRLQKTLKEGLRRCVYRRWEAEVQGLSVCARTIDLERMYRGNTPYPTGPAQQYRRNYGTREQALAALARASARRKLAGYENSPPQTARGVQSSKTRRYKAAGSAIAGKCCVKKAGKASRK